MFWKHHVSTLFVGAVIAFASGCVAESPAEGSPATEATASSLSGADLISMIAIVIATGNDDKRDDSHVWVRIDLHDGRSSFEEVGFRETWQNWQWSRWYYVKPPSGTRNQDIRQISVTWQQGGGGLNGDNWNLQGLAIYAVDTANGYWNFQGGPLGNPLMRFTGSATEYAWGWIP